MKSVVVSAGLLVLLTGFCLYVKFRTEHTVGALYEAVQAMPTETDVYEDNAQMYTAAVEDIGVRWSDAVGYLSYVCGYNALNRADEAVWDLYAAVTTEDWQSAVTARYQLLDALRRMRELEDIGFASVF